MLKANTSGLLKFKQQAKCHIWPTASQANVTQLEETADLVIIN